MVNFFKKHSTKIVVLVVNSLLVATGAMAINNQQKEKESLMAINNQSNDSEIPVAQSGLEIPIESADAVTESASEVVDDKNIPSSTPSAPVVSKPVVTTTKPKSTTTSQTTETKSTTASTPKVVSSPTPAPTPAPVVKSEPVSAPKPAAKTKAS